MTISPWYFRIILVLWFAFVVLLIALTPSPTGLEEGEGDGTGTGSGVRPALENCRGCELGDDRVWDGLMTGEQRGCGEYPGRVVGGGSHTDYKIMSLVLHRNMNKWNTYKLAKLQEYLSHPCPFDVSQQVV